VSPLTMLRRAIWLRPLLGGSIEKATTVFAAIDRHGLSVAPRAAKIRQVRGAGLCQFAGAPTVLGSTRVGMSDEIARGGDRIS
jgi:hypothetical protein